MATRHQQFTRNRRLWRRLPKDVVGLILQSPAGISTVPRPSYLRSVARQFVQGNSPIKNPRGILGAAPRSPRKRRAR